MLCVGAVVRRSAPRDAERPSTFQPRASERGPQLLRRYVATMKTHNEMVHEWMQDPAFIKEYDALEDEFVLFDELLQTQKDAGLPQTEIAVNSAPNQPERSTP